MGVQLLAQLMHREGLLWGLWLENVQGTGWTPGV